MQEEIANLTTRPMSASEVESLKRELSSLQEAYAGKIKATSARLEALRKKAVAAGQRAGEKGGAGDAERSAAADLKSELAVLRKFEETLQSQLSDTEMFFEAFETRVDDLQKQIEEGRNSNALEELKGEIEGASAQKQELAEAVEAVLEEQHALDAKVAGMEKRLGELSEGENSLSASKKKIAEIRRMAEEAKKQKKAVQDHLSDSVSLIRKQSSKIEGVLRKYDDAGGSQSLVDEYVEISEEMSRANEELAARQKDIGRKISEQAAALEAAKAAQAGGSYSKEEIQKVSFLLRELSHEQELLEEKVKVLAKESEILKMESQPGEPGGPAGGGAAHAPEMAPGEAAPPALVERVKLSQKDEADFERKRDELRSLIRKMWEEGKGGRGS
jgi:predicted  nucleic acid-binding Zn-ribbon protein